MRPFSYVRAGDAATAIALVAERPDGVFLAGGTCRTAGCGTGRWTG